jgi:hypothetical protein
MDRALLRTPLILQFFQPVFALSRSLICFKYDNQVIGAAPTERLITDSLASYSEIELAVTA